MEWGYLGEMLCCGRGRTKNWSVRRGIAGRHRKSEKAHLSSGGKLLGLSGAPARMMSRQHILQQFDDSLGADESRLEVVSAEALSGPESVQSLVSTPFALKQRKTINTLTRAPILSRRQAIVGSTGSGPTKRLRVRAPYQSVERTSAGEVRMEAARSSTLLVAESGREEGIPAAG